MSDATPGSPQPDPHNRLPSTKFGQWSDRLNSVFDKLDLFSAVLVCTVGVLGVIAGLRMDRDWEHNRAQMNIFFFLELAVVFVALVASNRTYKLSLRDIRHNLDAAHSEATIYSVLQKKRFYEQSFAAANFVRALLQSVWVTFDRFSDFRQHAGEHLEA
jgi:hypothetical protein